MKFLLPTSASVQCPRCGVPVDDVETAMPYDGTIALGPCGDRLTPHELERAWALQA